MKLLNTQTLELEFFATEEKPKYAILSHTWGSEEVLFEDVRNGKASLLECRKSGLEKVLKSAEIAAQNGYQYIWIDTCCIDKSSSAELSEAINSMFAWYKISAVCYAFLSGYQARDGKLSETQWFTRGWTLQELIAPPEVYFYDSAWTCFGDRGSLSSQITVITGIDEGLLRHRHYDRALSLSSYSISTRMSWAARRETTRVEDIAYCLLGIFDVAMPLLYGEGLKAFRRLQEEIVRHSNDQTFLAWDARGGDKPDAVFAAHPARFLNGHRFRTAPSLLSQFAATTVRGGGGVELEIHLAPCAVKLPPFHYRDAFLAVLNCSKVDDDFCCVSILLEETNAAPPRPAAPRSFRRLRNLVGNFFPPILVSPEAEINCDPFLVKPKLSEMVRCRILLHEPKNEWPISGPIERRARFTFLGGLMPGYYVRRQVPDPIASTWQETGLPTLCGSPGFLSDPFVYGAASISGGKCEFFIIWGILQVEYTSRRPQLSAANDKNETPFCKVSQNLDGTSQESDGLDTRDWLAKILKTVGSLGERDVSSARTILRPLGAFSSLTWVTDSGSICIEATIKCDEFVGRKMFNIELTMKEMGCGQGTS